MEVFTVAVHAPTRFIHSEIAMQLLPCTALLRRFMHPLTGGCKPGGLSQYSQYQGGAVILDNITLSTDGPVTSTADCEDEPANTYQVGGGPCSQLHMLAYILQVLQTSASACGKHMLPLAGCADVTLLG